MPKPPEHSDHVTVADLAQSLDAINKSTTWTGMNARELYEAGKLDRAGWEYAKRTHDEWVNDFRHVQTRAIMIALAVSVLLAITLPGGWRWPAGILVAFLIFSVAERTGWKQGFFEGYELGHRDALYKTLNVPEEVVRSLRRRADQLESDERLAATLLKTKKPAPQAGAKE